MGRKKGTVNQVVAHLFDASSMEHVRSFMGTSQNTVRDMIKIHISTSPAISKWLVLWGMGEVLYNTPIFEDAVLDHYDDGFFNVETGSIE